MAGSKLLAALTWLLRLVSAGSLITQTPLNVTVSSAEHNKSIFQCWQMLTPPISTQINQGVGGFLETQPLGGVSSFSLSAIPANMSLGSHVAPAKQWSIVLSGSILAYLPNKTDISQAVFVAAGANSVLFSDDTADVSSDGHVTLAVEETVLLQIPTANGTVPPHKVLHNGPCAGQELLS
ncbi:hypothetical protein BAUCODRAFT_80518 [Baudoinia panamericana UAMH 10762]|uniref:Small secreted protein n=1 Tax=Baudoinia panamericana (strain UAMH 10762) TaxID=717646 RepID=M2LBT5_BAUPA|nr:uncharacterized protein BAUCODRAFT_80518 [Baudoinia panamericana UAMH 10762]EMC91347.1 hypothetical protein BAUCODRAFT_80518 [Baudoinia panamericana UAMH 10762]